MNDDVLDLLTPGAVCKKRENPRQGAPVHVIMLTNLSLTPKQQETYPVQVIYTNETRQVFSRPVDSFCKLYDFNYVDADVETRIGDIFTPLSDDDEDRGDARGQIEIPRTGLPTATPGAPKVAKDEPVTAGLVEISDDDEDDDSEILPEHTNVTAAIDSADVDDDADDDEDDDEPTAAEDADAEEAANGDNDEDADADEEVTGATLIEFSMTTLEAPLPVLDHTTLSAALAGYAQEPDSSRGLITHRLAFALGGEVTMQSLVEAFRPNAERNTVDVFALTGPHFAEVVQWTDFVGVYPEIAGNDAYANVILIENVAVQTAEEAFLSEVEAHLEAQEDAGVTMSSDDTGETSLVGDMISAIVSGGELPEATPTLIVAQAETPVQAEVPAPLSELEATYKVMDACGEQSKLREEVLKAEGLGEQSPVVLGTPTTQAERPTITLKKSPQFGVQSLVQNIRVNQPTIRNS